jgi:hypothetical protein
MFTDMASISKQAVGGQSPVRNYAVNNTTKVITKVSGDEESFIPAEVSSYLKHDQSDVSNPSRKNSLPLGRVSLKPTELIGRILQFIRFCSQLLLVTI